MAFWWHQGLHQSLEHDKADSYITINTGTTAGAIINQLHQEGILAKPAHVKLYLKTLGKEIFQGTLMPWRPMGWANYV